MVATPQKVDLNSTYPCPIPYCQGGKLQPITLTQAWGCFQCQHVFTPTSDFLAIESQSSYLQAGYSQTWYWQGQRWVKVSSVPSPSGLWFTLVILTVVAVAAIVVLPPLLEPAIPAIIVTVFSCVLTIWAVFRLCFDGDEQ
ncbi:MAG: hypothetical protein AB4050_01350 [Synechococcus sp.]